MSEDRVRWGRAAGERIAAERSGETDVTCYDVVEAGDAGCYNDLCSCGHNRDDHYAAMGGSLACYVCVECDGFEE